MHRRLTKGQSAMAVAMIYPEAEKGGRGKKSLIIKEFNQGYLSQARSVNEWRREDKSWHPRARGKPATKLRVFTSPTLYTHAREGNPTHFILCAIAHTIHPRARGKPQVKCPIHRTIRYTPTRARETLFSVVSRDSDFPAPIAGAFFCL